jgi:AcrR family transcriptional regulator
MTDGIRICQDVAMARLTRSESKAQTRQRLIAEAERLFVEQGYSATSLEQIAQAAEVTKGAIYGHFASKEELLVSAIEAAPPPSFPELFDDSRPLPERLARFGRQMAESDQEGDARAFAAQLEFMAALLRDEESRNRYAANFMGKIGQLAEEDPDRPVGETTALEVWLIGTALAAGLQLYGLLMPEAFDGELRAKAMSVINAFYEPPEATESDRAR